MEPGSDWSSYLEKIAAANNEAALAAVEQALFGRKAGALTLALGALKDVPPEERKNVAADLNDWKKKLQTAIDAKRAALSSPADSELADRDKLDVTLSLPEKPRGHLHPIPEFIRQVEKVFGRMGFDVAYGPEIEEEQYNFNLLNIPDDHPARDTQDTFWIKDVPNRLLRTQTSPVQIHYMKEYKPPFRMICPGKVYRKDADATHSPMFHQFEGLMIGKDVNLANMKAVMETAVRELIRPDAEFRFRTGYFPFVEPGLEMDMRWPATALASAVAGRQREDAGHPTEGAWLEVCGCGMVHPNVLKNVGIDSAKWQGFAFGFGVERMLMIKHRIPDLRAFYEGDLRFLQQF